MNKLIIKNQLKNGEDNINFHFHPNTFEEHTHDYFEIMLITQGEATHMFNGKNYKTIEGDCWFISPSSTHSLCTNMLQDSIHLNIAISINHMRILCNAIDTTLLPTLLENNNSSARINLPKSEFTKTISLAHKFQALPFDNSSKRNGVLNIIAFTLIQNFYLQYNDTVHNIPQILQKIVKELTTIECLESTSKEIIKNIPYSYSHFEKIFKKHIGITFVQYLNSRKLEYIKSLLTTTDLSITTIANKVAMPSLGYFHQFFKENTGLTPMQYRKKHKGVSKLPHHN